MKVLVVVSIDPTLGDMIKVCGVFRTKESAEAYITSHRFMPWVYETVEMELGS